MAQNVPLPEPQQLADVFQWPGYSILLYTDNTIRILDERSNSAVQMKIGDLMMIFRQANGRLQEIRAQIEKEKADVSDS